MCFYLVIVSQGIAVAIFPLIFTASPCASHPFAFHFATDRGCAAAKEEKNQQKKIKYIFIIYKNLRVRQNTSYFCIH